VVAAFVPLAGDDGPPSAVAGSVGFLLQERMNEIAKTKRLHNNNIRRIWNLGSFLPEWQPDSNATGRIRPIGNFVT
jgi:hypothetical protein